MKRALALLVGGVLILGSALAAHAQAPTVSFGGQMRVFGFVQENVSDFTDSQDGKFRDSNSYYFQRWRLFTRVESADKKARAVWALEVGDITWGNGGGASGAEWRGCQGATAPGATAPGATSRVGTGSGGCLGADGVNVETKHAYLWVDTGQWLPGSSITLGIQSIVFMDGPLGGFMDEDGAAIKLNMKFDPVDIELYTVKLSEGARANADDADMFVARVGVNFAKDLRVTFEGMLVDEKSLGGQSIGDNFWIGLTAGVKLGDIQLDAAGVYGQRTRGGVVAGTGPFDESGFGGFVTARLPVGPVNIFAVGWYTSGDDTVGPAGCAAGTTVGCDTANYNLTKNSDKLPLPDSAASWFGGGGPFIAEWLFGNSSIGAPGASQLQYADPTGTYGIGASATYALTPAVSIGGGVAYVGATDAAGPYGDNLIEVDFGATYRFNPNLVLNLFGGVMFPDKGDTAWAGAFRTQYSF